MALINQSRQSHWTLEVAVVNQRNLVVPVVPWVGRCPEDPLTLRLVSLLFFFIGILSFVFPPSLLPIFVSFSSR